MATATATPSPKDLFIFDMANQLASAGQIEPARNALDSLDESLTAQGDKAPAKFAEMVRALRCEVMMSQGHFGEAVEVLDVLLDSSSAEGSDGAVRIQRLKFQRGSCLFALVQAGKVTDDHTVEKALNDLDSVLGAHPTQQPSFDNGLAGLMNGLSTEPDSIQSILKTLSGGSSSLAAQPPMPMPAGFPDPGFGFPGQQPSFPPISGLSALGMGLGDPSLNNFGPAQSQQQQVNAGITPRERLISHALRGLLSSRLLSSPSSSNTRTKESAINDLEEYLNLHAIVFAPAQEMDPAMTFAGQAKLEEEGREKMEGTAERLVLDCKRELEKLRGL